MARLAEGNQIIPRVCAAFRQRYFVVYFLCGSQPAVLLTQFAQRMLLHIAVTGTLPSSSISAAGLRIAVVLLIALGFQLGMLLTEPAIRQLGAAGIGTGTLGFLGHHFTSFSTDVAPLPFLLWICYNGCNQRKLWNNKRRSAL